MSGERSRAALVCLMLVGLAAVAYGSHVAHGGFYSDDWQLAGDYRFAAPPRYENAVRFEAQAMGARPLLAVVKPLPHALLGDDRAAHLLVTLALGAAAAFLFYLLLRSLTVPPWPAAASAGLAFLFPWSDSTKLWAVAGLNQLALGAYFGGALLALAGLRADGRRRVVLHAAALGLYAAALLTYEAVAVLMLVTGLLYAVVGSRRAVGRRWAVDAVLVLTIVLWARGRSTESLPGLGDMLSFSPHFAYQEGILALRAATPFPLVPLVTLAIGVLAVALFARRIARGGVDPTQRHRLRLAALAAVASVAASLPFLGYLQPLAMGINNRGNIALAYPLSALVVAVIALLTAAAVRSARLRAAWITPAAVVLCVLVAVGYVRAARSDVGLWDRAALLQGGCSPPWIAPCAADRRA